MKQTYYVNKKNYSILSNYDIYGGASKKSRKSKLTNKKISREEVSSKEPLNIVDWITYVEDNNLQLKIEDLKKMHNGDSIKIVASMVQSNGEYKWENGAIVNPIEYFSDDIVTFTYPNILDGHEYKYDISQFDPTYNPAEHDPIKPFYDDGNGNAVLGSGDSSILLSKLTNLPNIIIEGN